VPKNPPRRSEHEHKTGTEDGKTGDHESPFAGAACAANKVERMSILNENVSHSHNLAKKQKRI
jgi:hypothetical protein